MIEKIKEENVWDFLKNDNKPIMIYGMGNGAEKIISTLDTYGVKVSEIFASDEFVRGHSFLGYKVLKYSDIYDDFNVVLAFATHLENVIENIKKINNEHKVFAPDVPVCGGGLFTKEYVKEHNDEFDFVYNNLADEKSKSDYVDIINFKVSGKVDYLLKSYCDKDSVYKDILKLDICKLAEEKNQGKPIKVVANLPYYITTPIIMGLFESHVPLDSITIMVQKEVADRMQTGPGSKDYGALSLAVQFYAKPEIVVNVPPECFMPRPNVGSAVIRLKRHETRPVDVKDEKLMFRIIRASFNQRRKTLANGLNNSPEIGYTKEQIAAAIEELGRGASIRGEALTLEEFARLSNIFSSMSK